MEYRLQIMIKSRTGFEPRKTITSFPLKALNPLLTAFRKGRPKVKATGNDANTTQNYVHSFHNYFLFKMLSANNAKKIVENNPTPSNKA